MSRRASWLATVALMLLTEAGSTAVAGVLAWYPFDNDATDASGHGYNGTVLGTESYGTGVNGQAIQFVATADGVNIGVLPITSAFTVSLWVNFGSDHGAWLVSQLDQVGGNWYGWALKTTSVAGQYVPQFQVGNGTPSRVSFYDATFSTLWDMYNPDNPDRWYHLAITHDGVSTARTYIDGQLYAEKTDIPYAPATTTPVYIRRPLYSSGPENMDDVLILNRAMDATEIAELHSVGVSWPLSVSPGDPEDWVALVGSPAPGPIAYTVHNDDGGATHTIDIAEVDAQGNAVDHPWLSLSTNQIVDLPASGSAEVVATLNHTVIAPGTHTGYVRFSTGTRSVTRQIQLTVLGCQWVVGPGPVSRYYLEGSGDTVAPAVFTITNTGAHGLTYTVQEVADQPWLTLNKTGSTAPLDYQAADQVTATISPAGLAAGEYACDQRFVNNCNPSEEMVFTVTLTVESDISLPGLLAWYRFEDSARDWTGNGWNGTLAGAPLFTEGQDGRAIELRGVTSSDAVDLGDVPCPNPAVSQEMSVVLWYRGRAEEIEIDASWLINKISSSGGWAGWQIKVDHEWFGLGWEVPTLNFRWCHDGLRDSLDTSNPNRNIAVPTLYDGHWHQIAFTIEDADGAGGNLVNVRGYFDGLLLEGQNIWNQTPEIIRAERLGTKFDPAASSVNVWLSGDLDRVKGGVDELSLWDRALSPDEILAMYEGRFDVHPLPWPDSDEDGDVDMDDFAQFQRCSTPSGTAFTDWENCSRFDRDGDSDIDESDFLKFAGCGTGPNIPLDPGHPPFGCEL